MKPKKWIEYVYGSGRSTEINPKYIEALEDFAKRAAANIATHWRGNAPKEGGLWNHCSFCTEPIYAVPGTPGGVDCKHDPDCIVLAAEKYLKQEER